MDKVLRKLVKMVKKYPEGIPLNRLAVFYGQTYHKNLTLSELGFDSITSLVSSLNRDLVLEEDVVFHKDQLHKTRFKAGRGARAEAVGTNPKVSHTREEVLLNMVNMMKEHPAGVPLKKLAIVYSQTYHQNLTLSELGFDSMTSLVSYLDTALVVRKEVVFHPKHQCVSRPASARSSEDSRPETPQSCDSDLPRVSRLQLDVVPPLVSSSQSPGPALNPLITTAQPANTLTQQQLYQRVLQVMQQYQLSAPSMQQLQACYYLHFMEQLPLSQYQSLYDSWEGSFTNLDPAKTQTLTGVQDTPAAEQRREREPTTSPQHQHQPQCQPLPQHQPQPKPLPLLQPQPQPQTQPQLQPKPLPLLQPEPQPLPLLQPLPQLQPQPLLQPQPQLQPQPLLQPQPQPQLQPQPQPQPQPQLQPQPQPQPATASFLLQSDFPALGEVVAKEKKSKGRDAATRESGAPAFKEAYHAQLREVHGANMRALEVLEADEQEAPGRMSRRFLNQDSVNSLMQEVIRDIAAEGELVTRERVISRVCQLMQIPSLEHGHIKPWNIPALKDLQYMIREINMFIECTEAVSSICTLYELGQAVAGLKDKKHYEELNLGPLCKLPLVHRMFKVDSSTKDDDIRQIQTVDILKHLRTFRRQSSKPKVDLAEFMKYLSDHYSCDSPYELGIRIHSVGLPISTLIKVSKSEHVYLEQARELIQRELEEETLERLRKIKRSVLEPVQGATSSSLNNMELRKKYATITAAEVVLAVFSKAEGVFSPRMKKHVQSFLLQVSENRLATALFQLCICGGSLAVPQDLAPKDKTSSPTPSRAEENTPLSLPGEVKMQQFLRENLSAQSSAFTLANMAALEKKLNKQFQVKEFPSLQQGSFLDFLVKHIQLLQDSVGSSMFLSSIGGSSVELTGSSFRPSRQDVFEFINQCGDIKSTETEDLTHIESALRVHFRVRDSRDLGLGTLNMLAGLVKRQRGLAGGRLSPVHYQSALFARHTRPRWGEARGQLGEVSKEQALCSLLCCPLLEDLSEWSQWNLVFKPHQKSLKEFIERNTDNTGLSALEVSPGVLLRITSHTGDKHFLAAVMTLDPVGTAGHLVSMVVADGIANAPTALLANHMQSALASAVAQEDLSRDDEDVQCYSRVAKFLLECFRRIPARLCQALLQKVFLEPFSGVLGQTKSKQVLVAVAQSDPRHLTCLHQLGILLGVTEWIRDFQKKLSSPPSQNHHDAHTEEFKSYLLESESSSLSGLDSTEDEYQEENMVDSASSSCLDQQVNGEHAEEDEEDAEELYELTSQPNGETSEVCSDAGGGQDEEEKVSDPDEKDSNSQSEASEDPHRALIEEIRKTEFGVGVELNAEGQKLMHVSQERLGRSLDRLSTELYSKDTHFVLELIQNADDNSYPEDGEVPALAFVVQRDCITILNNEVGFQERNIRAICDVGRSTKGKHTYGYIGQKGIGFKSVFKVSDCPEIHSKGFHLRFDRTCGPMGYILPHWAEDHRPVDAQLQELHLNSWTTKILLPLRAESHHTRHLFHDLHPSLLLFLHRLRSITIYNQSEQLSEQRVMRMTRRDLKHNMLEVEHTHGTERWLVVKARVQPKEIKEGVESTELALAFQLDSSPTGTDIIFKPPKQPVFAYLPLRSFGFSFIIQGDFDIPSSREDVVRDSSWNQWLRSEIPQLFLQAMEVFMDHPDFRGLKGLCQFLQFVPLPEEVLDFFKPVAGQIIQQLKGKAFLPTLTTDGRVVYRLPSQVAVCEDPVIRDVIGGDELERHLSLSYLHAEVSNAAPPLLLPHLGVRYLRGGDVTTVTSAMAKELSVEGVHSEDGLRQLARLLVCNFRALEHGCVDADSILHTLRELPIIPLADGQVVALNGEGVFFPMEETQKKKRKKAQADSGPLSALYEDLSVVHPALLTCLDPLESEQVRELLKRLGVHELEPEQLLQEHIYPTLHSNKWKSKPSEVVVSYLVFIKQHSSSSQYTNAAVPVLTNRGLQCPNIQRVHFSKEYGNIDLPAVLPGYDWLLLSPCYVHTDGDMAGWRELFSRLGVRDGLIIRKEKRTLTSNELALSPWSAESSRWIQTPGDGCVIDDYPCDEFQALASAQLTDALLLQQRTALLELLANNWDTGPRYSQYLTAQVVDQDGRLIRSTMSSFHHLLCTLEWVPAYQLHEGDQRERKYLRPNSVYLTSPEISSLLGTHVCYVDLKPGEFSRALGMRHSISVEALITYLKQWCVGAGDEQPEESEESEGATFTSTVQHIHNVYLYLHNNCPQSCLKQLFQHTPAVFIQYSRRENDWCSGRFYHLKKVCWTDPTSMFQRYRQLTPADGPIQPPKVLVPFYGQLEGMKAFFTRLLSVDLSPTMFQYVGLLEIICSSCPSPTAEVLQDVSVLFATLAQKCLTTAAAEQESTGEHSLNPGYCSTLKGMVSERRVFPTKDNTWVSLARKPMMADNKELEKVFKDSRLCLLNLPPAEKRSAARSRAGATATANSEPIFSEQERSLFLEICGIRRLSQCVKSEPQTENLRPSPSLQATVRSVVPYIQRFLLHHDELAEVYSEIKDNNISEKIKKMQFNQVGKLYIRYQLDISNSDRELVELQDVICLLKDHKELYIQKDHLSARLDVCRELVKLFCTETSHRKELMHFLSGLITSINDQDPRSLTRFLQKEDIRELPSDEQPWEVPEPPKPEVHLERVLSRSWTPSAPPVEPGQPPQADEEGKLICWPPRASILNTGNSRTAGADGGVVEAVMKMWPPPAAPTEGDSAPRGGSHAVPHSPSICEADQPIRSSFEGRPAVRGSRPAEQSGSQKVDVCLGESSPAVTYTNAPREPEHAQNNEAGSAEGAEQSARDPRAASPPPCLAETATSTPPAADPLCVPDAVASGPSVFQGAAAETPRPPLHLDFPAWNAQATLEDLELLCSRPDTVVLSDDETDCSLIGEWGEQLVNSFLCHWRDSGKPGSPAHILWCNQSGESGQPYDFKLTFGSGGASGAPRVVYVEVKATIKKDRSFVHLSANELDLALKERDRYHLYRVYCAGSANNVRLCRIQNLAQHLHTKDLALYLFL